MSCFQVNFQMNACYVLGLKVQAILDGRCEEMQAGPAMEVPISIKDDATRQEDELEEWTSWFWMRDDEGTISCTHVL